MTDALGLRERKKLETRRTLIRSAFALCTERGIDAVTVADIAAGANVSTRTFFNYFSSKEEAVLGGTGRAERFVELLAARPDNAPLWEALRATLAQLLAEEDAPLRDLLAQMRLVSQSPTLFHQQMAIWGEMERVVVAEVARRVGASPQDLYPRLVVAAVVSAVRVATDHWLEAASGAPLAAVIDDALVVISDGLQHPDQAGTSA